MNIECCANSASMPLRLRGQVALIALGIASAFLTVATTQESYGAQQDAAKEEKAKAPKVEKIVIAEDPKTIDPATLVYPVLAKKATASFDENSISEVVEWIRSELKVDVLLDEGALEKANILPSEPVNESLKDEAVFHLLNRMRSVNLAWYVEDDILRITSVAAANEHLTTVPINIGSFLDQEFDQDDLLDTIISVIEPESWDEQGGPGTCPLLGDVLFVTQTDRVHREIAGLLKALENHGRRTFINDPPQHEQLRQKLLQKVTVDFKEVPLSDAIAKLTEETGAEIRLDHVVLRESRIRSRVPVTLKLTQQKLGQVLDALLARLKLKATLQDGVILITSQEKSLDLLKTAIFDVRDLCSDRVQTDGLLEAISTHTPEQWTENGGAGEIAFPKTGTMVVLQTEDVLDEVSKLLEAYREALKVSKVRTRGKIDPKEKVDRYYRMPTVMANDLKAALVQMVEPATWKSEAQPDGFGTVLMISSKPDFRKSDKALLVETSVLIIKQSRENHEKIQEIIRRVEFGDSVNKGGGFGGGGLGGGGGGGIFSIPQSKMSRLNLKESNEAKPKKRD